MILKLQKAKLTVVRNDAVEIDEVQDMYLINEDDITNLVFTTVDSRDKIHVWKSEYYHAHPSIYPVNEVDTNNYLEAFKKLEEERKQQLKEAALSKLTKEEKEVLGLS